MGAWPNMQVGLKKSAGTREGALAEYAVRALKRSAGTREGALAKYVVRAQIERWNS